MENPNAQNAQADAIQTVRALNRAVERRLFGSQIAEWIRLNLSMGQVKALMVLAREAGPGMNVTALAEALHVGKPAASILVDQLVQLGYVERTEDHEDRRRTLVALTPKALDLVERLRQGGYEPFSRWLAALDADDLAAMTRGLRALLAVIERESPATPVAAADDDAAAEHVGATGAHAEAHAEAHTESTRHESSARHRRKTDTMAAAMS